MNREQFTEFVKREQAELRRFLLALCCGDRFLADDIAQEALVKAYLSCAGVMQKYGETTKIQKALGDWLCGYAEHKQPFDEIKHRHTLKEVGDVAEGKYDWKIKREQRNLSR